MTIDLSNEALDRIEAVAKALRTGHPCNSVENAAFEAAAPRVVLAMVAEIRRLRTLAETRAPMCQCSDDEACRFVRERDAAKAELARLRDDPELDGTDAAHPAWWRGHDARALVERTTEWRDEVTRLREALPSRELCERIDDAIPHDAQITNWFKRVEAARKGGV